MNRIDLSTITALALFLGVPAMAWEKISLPPTSGVSRADIYIAPATGNPSGTLILCPGRNGNGEEMLDTPEWRDYAENLNLNLVGLSFASDDDPRDRGYFQAETGSGEVLLDGLNHILGPRRGPLLLYGFSRGAQFTYSFSRWKPGLVMAWCAYSATEWERPENSGEAKGIIACGEEDEPNYSASVFQFLQGRCLSKPWTWLSLAQTGHRRSPALEAFVRAYFASVLVNPGGKGLWLDVQAKTRLTSNDVQRHPTLATWLPDEAVAQAWRKLHQP